MGFRGSILAAAALSTLACWAAPAGAKPPIAIDDYVYLRVQNNFSKSACNERLSFQRIGPDGLVAGPQDANGNFTIPAGRSLLVTDIHVVFGLSPKAAAGRQQLVSIYIQSPAHQSETAVWFPTLYATPGQQAVYDRALTTGVRVSAGNLVCTAYSDQTDPTSVVLTGYLQ